MLASHKLAIIYIEINMHEEEFRALQELSVNYLSQDVAVASLLFLYYVHTSFIYT